MFLDVTKIWSEKFNFLRNSNLKLSFSFIFFSKKLIARLDFTKLRCCFLTNNVDDDNNNVRAFLGSFPSFFQIQILIYVHIS